MASGPPRNRWALQQQADNASALFPIPTRVATTVGAELAPGSRRMWWCHSMHHRWATTVALSTLPRPLCRRSRRKTSQFLAFDKKHPGAAARGEAQARRTAACSLSCHPACKARSKSSTGWRFRSPSPGHLPSLLPPPLEGGERWRAGRGTSAGASPSSSSSLSPLHPQSMWSWKMRRTYPGYPSSWMAQKGQAACRPLVPCGMDTEAQYLTVFSEAMCPQGLKAWLGGSLST